MRYIPLTLQKFLDTFNEAVNTIENFLEAFEVSEHLKKWTEWLLTENNLEPLDLDFV